MIPLLIVLAVVILICFIRLGVIVQYGENGLSAEAVIGPVRFGLLPRGEKKESKKKKEEEAVEATAKAGRLASLKNQLPSINKALARLRRKLRINELTIHYLAAGPNPAAAALYFGGVSAGYGILLPLLENNFNIKKRDLRTAVDFEASEPYIYLRSKITLAVWEAVYVGFGLVKNMVKSENMRAKIRKAV